MSSTAKLPEDWQQQLDAELAEMRETTARLNLLARRPIRLDGCTCGGIGDTGAHRRDCAWSMNRA